jgi:hypothetical protein
MVVKKSNAQCKNSKCQETKHSKAKCSKAECEVIICLNISSIRYFIEKLEITYSAYHIYVLYEELIYTALPILSISFHAEGQLHAYSK